jgi:hypothetical protein
MPSALNIPEAKYPCVYPDRRTLVVMDNLNAVKSCESAARHKEFQRGTDESGRAQRLLRIAGHSARVADLAPRRALNDFAPRLFK